MDLKFDIFANYKEPREPIVVLIIKNSDFKSNKF